MSFIIVPPPLVIGWITVKKSVGTTAASSNFALRLVKSWLNIEKWHQSAQAKQFCDAHPEEGARGRKLEHKDRGLTCKSPCPISPLAVRCCFLSSTPRERWLDLIPTLPAMHPVPQTPGRDEEARGGRRTPTSGYTRWSHTRLRG